MIELTPQEEQQILKAREARAPRVDAQQADLLAQLAALNSERLCAPFPPIKELLDAETLAAVERVQGRLIGDAWARCTVPNSTAKSCGPISPHPFFSRWMACWSRRPSRGRSGFHGAGARLWRPRIQGNEARRTTRRDQ